MLKELQNAGNDGEFYTPRAVTQFMVQMIKPKLGEKILDPGYVRSFRRFADGPWSYKRTADGP